MENFAMASTNFGASSYNDETPSIIGESNHQASPSNSEPTVVCKIKKHLLGYDNVAYTDRYKEEEERDAVTSVHSFSESYGILNTAQ